MPRNDAIRKLEKVKDLIGTLTDAEVAEAAGVSIGSVRAYRGRNGIAPAGRRRSKSELKKAQSKKNTGVKKVKKKHKLTETMVMRMQHRWRATSGSTHADGGTMT